MLLANIFPGKSVWNVRYWSLPWGRQNCMLTNILIKFMANKHHCISWAYLQEKQCLSKPVIPLLSTGGVWQGKALSSYPQVPEWWQKEKKKKKKKEKRKGKEDHREKWHRKGKRVSAALLPSSAHLARTMVERTSIQSQPLRDFCLLVIILRDRLLLALPAAFIAKKKPQT